MQGTRETREKEETSVTNDRPRSVGATSARSVAGDRDPVQTAGRLAVVVYGVMHRAAVVPHDHIISRPTVAVHIVWLRRVLVQIVDERQAN